MLYLLQLSQYERSVATPSEKEKKIGKILFYLIYLLIALQLAQSLSELSSRIPPTALLSQDAAKQSFGLLEET